MDVVNIEIVGVIDSHILVEVGGGNLELGSVDGLLGGGSNLETVLVLGSSSEVVLVSKFTEGTNDIVRNSETINNTNTLEVENVVLLDSLSNNGRDVLSCIRFTEKEERRLRGKTDLIETTTGGVVELVEGIEELLSNLILVLGNFRRGVSIRDTSTDRLINKEDIVRVGPSVLVGGEVESTVGGLVDMERTRFVEVTELGRATRTTV